MLKTVVLLLCLTVTVVSAGWSKTMSFQMNGMSFMCSLLSGGMYDCNHSGSTPPAPRYQWTPPAPRPRPQRREAQPAPAQPAPVQPTPTQPGPPPTLSEKPKPAAAAEYKPEPTPPSGPTSTPPPPTGDANAPAALNTDAWNANIVAAHNQFRGAMADTPPLKWDGSLASGCISYAQKLAGSSCTLQHSGGDYGENLYQGWGDGCKKAVDVIGYMFSECAQYQWGNPSFSMATGHFTQIVWKKTTGVAAGGASGSGGCCIVVLRYSPAGNVQGQFSDNVATYKGGDSSACKPQSSYTKKV